MSVSYNLQLEMICAVHRKSVIITACGDCSVKYFTVVIFVVVVLGPGQQFYSSLFKKQQALVEKRPVSFFLFLIRDGLRGWM